MYILPGMVNNTTTTTHTQEVKIMTPKELLYLEDTLGMEQQLQIKCADYSSKVQSPQLKNVLTQMSGQHQAHFNNRMTQLNT
jgi:hypothetical protein